MALPAEIAELRLPRGVFRGQVSEAGERALPLGLPALEAVLPGGGLPRGSVVELAVSGGSALATTLALAAVRSVQQEGRLRGGEAPWCAFVDPSGTLFGPGVAQAGVTLERLLVVRPPLEALARTALRVVESHAFSVVVVDTVGSAGAELEVALGSWPRVVRRLAMAAEGTNGAVLLVTDRDARRPLPLPVAQRIELARLSEDELSVRIAKDRRGRVSSPRTVRWTRPAPPGDDHERRAG
jgi:recombination protein RecA